MSFFDPVAPSYDSWYETPVGRFVDEVETKLAFDLLGRASQRARARRFYHRHLAQARPLSAP